MLPFLQLIFALAIIVTAVKDQAKIDSLVEAAQSVVGDLEQPNTGFLFVLPVSQVYGRSKL